MEIKPNRLNVISGAMWRANVFLKTNVCLSFVFHVIGELVRMSAFKIASEETNAFSLVKQITVKVYNAGQMRENVWVKMKHQIMLC